MTLFPVGWVLNTSGVTVAFSVRMGRMGVVPHGRTMNQEITCEKVGVHPG